MHTYSEKRSKGKGRKRRETHNFSKLLNTLQHSISGVTNFFGLRVQNHYTLPMQGPDVGKREHFFGDLVQF